MFRSDIITTTSKHLGGSGFPVKRIWFKAVKNVPNNPDYPTLLYKTNKNIGGQNEKLDKNYKCLKSMTASQHEQEEQKKQEEQVRKLCRCNNWTMPWTGTIYSYQHYHATVWEVVFVISGRGVVVLGNDTDNGIFLLEPGDVVLLPPGVGHKQVFSNELSSTSELDEFGELVVMGSYPKEGKHTVDEVRVDDTINYDNLSLVSVASSICEVAYPEHCPVFGTKEAMQTLLLDMNYYENKSS